MSDEHTEPCAACSARDSVLAYYRDHVADNEVVCFLNGVMEAIALVSAVNVITGREAEERQVLIDEIGSRFDRAVVAQATVNAAGTVKQ